MDQTAAPPPLPGTGAPPSSPPPALPRTRETRSEAEIENEIVGTWFARIGAIALIVGAAFGFKYGIDQGFIGPRARVITGIALGLAMLWAGERARRREWARFAQAITACGLGTMLLSIWAAFHLYSFLSAPQALGGMLAVTLTGVALALRHDSLALAVLATITAFADPILVGGRAEPAAMYGYILIVDAGVVALAALRRWPSLNLLAAGLSWALYGLAAREATTGIGIGYASAIFAVFSVAALATRGEDFFPQWRTLLVAANGLAYFTAGVALLSGDHRDALGAFVFGIAAAHAGLGAALHHLGLDRDARGATTGMALGFFTIAPPIQWEGLDVALAWTVQGAALSIACLVLANRFALYASIGLIGLSLAASLGQDEFGALYDPGRLLISKESLVFVAQIASALILTAALRRSEVAWAPQTATASYVTALFLGLMWMSLEAYGHYRTGETVEPANRQALQFSLSAIWGLYAAALLAVGIMGRSRLTRSLGIGLLGLTIVKMSLADLWTLSTGFRTLGFLGLGAVLLGASLSYHRFRSVIFGSPARESGN